MEGFTHAMIRRQMVVNDSVLRMRAMPRASTLTRSDESSCETEVAAALFPPVLRRKKTEHKIAYHGGVRSTVASETPLFRNQLMGVERKNVIDGLHSWWHNSLRQRLPLRCTLDAWNTPAKKWSRRDTFDSLSLS